MTMDAFLKLDEAQIVDDPFPYAVIENVLPAELSDALIQEMPPIDVLTSGGAPGSNKRFNLSYAQALTAPVSPLWCEMLRQSASQGFLDRLLRLFGPSIHSAYPDFEDRFGPIHKLRAVPRTKKTGNMDKTADMDSVAMDAQIALNTPALTPGTSVRPPHLDRLDKLFVGLLYLRLPQDDSTGADLQILTPIDARPTYGPQRMLPWESCRHVRTIPYRNNTLLLFINTPRSLHAVTPRQATRHPRYFINLVGEMPEPLFHVECTAPSPSTASPDRDRSSWLGRVWKGLPGARVG